MSLSVILLIGLIVCMAMGPIFMMQPSKRQKQVARMRALAAKQSLVVRLQEVEGTQCALYVLPWPKGVKWRSKVGLIKKSYAHDAHLQSLWELSDLSIPDTLATALDQYLQELTQAGIEAKVVEVNAQGVAIGWGEGGTDAAFDLLYEQLVALKDRLIGQF